GWTWDRRCCGGRVRCDRGRAGYCWGFPRRVEDAGMPDHRSTEWSALLSGPDQARRPSGPISGLLVVAACTVLGPPIALLVLMPLLGVSAQQLVSPTIELSTQFALLLSHLGALVLLLLWVWFKERRPVSSLGLRPTGRVSWSLLAGGGVALLVLAVPLAVNVLSGRSEERRVGEGGRARAGRRA